MGYVVAAQSLCLMFCSLWIEGVRTNVNISCQKVRQEDLI